VTWGSQQLKKNMIDLSLFRKVGQMNGQAVLELRDFAFGKPSRVAARISLGRGNLISIEREIAFSGPIHTKGFLILSDMLQKEVVDAVRQGKALNA